MKFVSGMILTAMILGSALADEVPSTKRPADIVVPPPPPMPQDSNDKVAQEPTTTIVEKDNTTFTEYRIGGRLYMVKVQPKVGPPYYLRDETGEGLQPVSGRDDGVRTAPPMWVIKTF